MIEFARAAQYRGETSPASHAALKNTVMIIFGIEYVHLWTRAFHRSCIEHFLRNIEVLNDYFDPDIFRCQVDQSSSLISADRDQEYNYYNECISSHFFAD